jgi:hypothetical protein
MRKKINLFCDFDGTSVNSMKRLVEMLNKKFNKNQDWTKIKKYSATDLFPEASVEDVIGVFADKDFFNGLEIFEGYQETLLKHQHAYDYHLATIGTRANLDNKEVWCKHNFKFNYKYEPIEKVGTGKETVNMKGGILIDDHIKNLKSSNASVKILYKGGFETEWNTLTEDDVISGTLYEVNSWKEVDEILSFIAKVGIKEVINE